MPHYLKNQEKGEKHLIKNIILSISAQILSLAVSFVLGFIVPKCIDEYQYSYWQTFLLYLGYVGILHFGLLDGLVLRYSQYDYDEIDKNKFRSQFQFLLFLTTILCFLGITLSSIVFNNISQEIFILVSIGIITKNLFTYTSYTFQITNRITHYAGLVILQRASYAIIIIILLFVGVNNFVWYCLADLMGDIIAIVFGLISNKKLYFGRSLPLLEALREVWFNISSGIFLMIANFSSSFLIGGAKMVIQWRWDELVFGKAAFSFSLTNLFLTFITAMSVVLFPSLKRMKEEELPTLYGKIRDVISPLLFIILAIYFPLSWVLKSWLPNYSESLVYLGILLPITIFSSKVSLLTNNYLKAYRKEKMMLIINVISVILGFALSLFFAYALDNLDALLYSVVSIVILRSIASEIVVGKIIRKNQNIEYVVEFCMTIIFIFAARYLSLWWGCLVYAVALVAYFIINRKKLVPLFKRVKKILYRKT